MRIATAQWTEANIAIDDGLTIGNVLFRERTSSDRRMDFFTMTPTYNVSAKEISLSLSITNRTNHAYTFQAQFAGMSSERLVTFALHAQPTFGQINPGTHFIKAKIHSMG